MIRKPTIEAPASNVSWGRFLPFNVLSDDWPLLGGSGHRNFDAKPRVYEFVSGCFGSEADVQTGQLLSGGSVGV